jgi:predicted metalloprotease with PDZ domain
MVSRRVIAIAIVSMLTLQSPPQLAYAENQMGYRLLSMQEASRLPRHHGALGMDVERAQQITDSGMTFDLIRVKQVRRGSPGDRAGFRKGDQIIAVDGQVFPSIAAFGAYVGSMSPGSRVNVDYIPAGGGPENAERVPVIIGDAGRPSAETPQNRQSDDAASSGMSTRTKIGIAAAALFGCYELGCFSKSKRPAGTSTQGQ